MKTERWNLTVYTMTDIIIRSAHVIVTRSARYIDYISRNRVYSLESKLALAESTQLISSTRYCRAATMYRPREQRACRMPTPTITAISEFDILHACNV